MSCIFLGDASRTHMVLQQGGVPVQRSPRIGAHQLVDLGERWVLDMQAVRSDPVQGCVVQHHLGGQKRVTAPFLGEREQRNKLLA